VQRYVPDFEKRWQAYAQPAGGSWRVDETVLVLKDQIERLHIGGGGG
jgi:transposase-like protein